MKNKIIALLLAAIMAVSVTGCTTVSQGHDVVRSIFVQVEDVNRLEGGWEVYYHRDTRVMYVRGTNKSGSGTWTVMLGADGKPLLWEATNDD